MQRTLVTSAAILVFGVTVLFAQAAQTFTGTVSDAMCGAHHMMKDATSTQCTRECVRQGSDFALIRDGKVYTLKGDKTQIDKFAGEKAVVKGKLAGTVITVDSISSSK